MKSSCVQQPNNDRYIQVYEWQIAFCNQNHCAAFLLSNFIAWHDWKLNHDEYYLRANNIAELHGDGRPNNQNAYLFFTMGDLADGILNLYGKNAINTALQLLEDLKVISVHKNPNPRYHFDKTKYFMFYPEVCNEWIKTSLETKENQNQTVEDLNQSFDPLKEDDRSLESNRPSLKKGEAITYTTSNINNNNNNARDVLLSNKEFAEPIIQNNISENACTTWTQPKSEQLNCSQTKSPIPDDFYPNAQTIEKALSQGLMDVTNPEKISQFIRYNKSNGRMWSDYNALFIRWLELDLKHNQRMSETLSQKTFRRSSDASYSRRESKTRYTLEDVILANRDAVSPDGERLFPDFEIIEGEYGMALDCDDESLRDDVY